MVWFHGNLGEAIASPCARPLFSKNKQSLALSLMQGAEPQLVPVPDGVLDVVAQTKPNKDG